MGLPFKPCPLCQAQVMKARDEAPHPRLALKSATKPYSGVFGAGQDFRYECNDCGAWVFHSIARKEICAWSVALPNAN